MDENLKNMLSTLFSNYCFILTEKGNIPPTYFLIKDKQLTMMLNNSGAEFNLYADLVLHQAKNQNVDGLALIIENNALVSNKNDKSIEATINGTIKLDDHPDAKPYLILYYVSNIGEQKALFGKIEKDPCGVKFIRDCEWVTSKTLI